MLDPSVSSRKVSKVENNPNRARWRAIVLLRAWVEVFEVKAAGGSGVAGGGGLKGDGRDVGAAGGGGGKSESKGVLNRYIKSNRKILSYMIHVKVDKSTHLVHIFAQLPDRTSPIFMGRSRLDIPRLDERMDRYESSIGSTAWSQA